MILLSLLTKLTDLLGKWHLKIASAESCTGGLIATLLTELPGSSVWYDRGFISYSNLAKQEMLGVDATLITKYGAVSEQVAIAMAHGALNNSKADTALAITGIAGPGGGSIEKPVGTVCFAFIRRDYPLISMCCYFEASSRQQVRQLACNKALEGMISLLQSTSPGSGSMESEP